MRVYKLDEHLVCHCGHERQEHHHSVVINKDYLNHPLVINGTMALECEHSRINGHYFLRKGEKEHCMCNSFRPRARNVQKLVDEWRKK